MNAHCLQHEPFEGMAAIETWLTENNFKISYTKFFESDKLPETPEIDWLIIMGGGMSVNDEAQHKWLIKEKAFIRKCIEEGKVVIGICLGAQLIANTLGAKVYRNYQKEIGWFPIRKLKGVKSKILNDLPEEISVFHWHGETFDLPDGAELVASSEACRNQIFVINEKAIGFQCHLETTAESLKALSDSCKSELIQAPYIQSEEAMVWNEKKYAGNMHKVLFLVLDKIKESA